MLSLDYFSIYIKYVNKLYKWSVDMLILDDFILKILENSLIHFSINVGRRIPPDILFEYIIITLTVFKN